MCLTSAVAASLPVTQEVTGLSPFNDKHFCHWIRWKTPFVAILVHEKGTERDITILLLLKEKLMSSCKYQTKEKSKVSIR